MFTGIVEATGTVVAAEHRDGDRRFRIEAPDGFLRDSAVGDSIAVSGVCLTAIAFEGTSFDADVSVETLQLTTAAGWVPGRKLNLERSLTPSRQMGGHFVSGHVDGVSRLLDAREEARSWRLEFELPAALSRYVAPKGSITIDGISLTVNEVGERSFGVNIIPHTRAQTSLGSLEVGDSVNLEVDLIARYLERLTAARN